MTARTLSLAQRLTMKDETRALSPSKLSDTEIRMLALDVVLLAGQVRELTRERAEVLIKHTALVRQAIWTSEAVQRAVDEIAEKSSDEVDVVALYEHLCAVFAKPEHPRP